MEWVGYEYGSEEWKGPQGIRGNKEGWQRYT